MLPHPVLRLRVDGETSADGAERRERDGRRRLGCRARKLQNELLAERVGQRMAADLSVSLASKQL